MIKKIYSRIYEEKEYTCHWFQNLVENFRNMLKCSCHKIYLPFLFRNVGGLYIKMDESLILILRIIYEDYDTCCWVTHFKSGWVTHKIKKTHLPFLNTFCLHCVYMFILFLYFGCIILKKTPTQFSLLHVQEKLQAAIKDSVSENEEFQKVFGK